MKKLFEDLLESKYFLETDEEKERIQNYYDFLFHAEALRLEVGLIEVGYWRKKKDSGEFLPWPEQSIHTDDDEIITKYLAKGKMRDSYKGESLCRICGIRNGSCDLTDGIYLWPSGLVHYVREHGVKLPKEFVDYVKEKSAK